MKKWKLSFQNLFRGQRIEFAVVYLLLFLVYALLIAHTGLPFDTYCWKDWAIYIFTNGLHNIYRSYTNYLPGTHYIFYLFGKIEGSVQGIDIHIYRVKLFVLPFDFLAGFYLVKMIKEKFKNPSEVFIYSLFFFLNIFYLYNTIIWGQFDSIFTAFVFISVYYALKEKVLLSIISAVIALNFKLQAIVFMPLIALLLIPLFTRQFSIKKFLTWLIIPVVIQLLIIWPFLFNGDIHRLISVVSGSVGKYPVISINAFNIWCWLIQGNLREVHDTGLFHGVSYNHWGLFLFLVSSLFVLFPLLADVWKKRKMDTDKILLIASLLPLVFFFFNTQMHERYGHPAILFIAAWSIRTKKFVPYVLVSIAYFLNLEAFMQYLDLTNYKVLIFTPRFISGLYFIVMAILSFELYKKSFYKSYKAYKGEMLPRTLS